jgi:hypothetical protein
MFLSGVGALVMTYFGSCLGVFEHDEVWKIGHYLVLSGYPQPFIDCVYNNLTDGIQRKVEKHFLLLRSCPGFQNYICPK